MIEKHLLITVSENSSLAGIHFVDSFFTDKKNLKVTLLYVAPTSSSSDSSGLSEAWLSPGEKRMGKISIQTENILTNSRKILCKAGFRNEQIDTKIATKLQTKVKDIIREGHDGRYDAVVLGRRTVSRFENFLVESVSDEILEQSFDFPLWICRTPEVGRKNVLLCLDGSDTSIRAADHVGYMVGKNEDHQITLFHVDRGQKINIAQNFEKARKILTDHNVPEGRIKTKTVKALRVTRAIHHEVENHKYAVVAIGLLGRQNEGIKDWFMSTKSIDLVKAIDKAVLWGCH